jgi:hypothetical protein
MDVGVGHARLTYLLQGGDSGAGRRAPFAANQGQGGREA